MTIHNDDPDYWHDLASDRGDDLPEWKKLKKEALVEFTTHQYRVEHGLEEEEEIDFFNPPHSCRVI